MTVATNLVILVGTSHPIQRGDCRSTPELREGFKMFLAELCDQALVALVAEEMSKDSLDECNVDQSIPQILAGERELLYLACDPGYADRKSLGIHTDIDAVAWQKGWTASRLLREKREDRKKREGVWLKRLSDACKWPVLFVCGSEHVGSFSRMLRLNGIRVQIKAKSWGAPKNRTV